MTYQTLSDVSIADRVGISDRIRLSIRAETLGGDRRGPMGVVHSFHAKIEINCKNNKAIA